MTRKDKNIAILIHIILCAILLSCISAFAINILSYFKQEHQIENLFSNIFGLSCIIYFAKINFPLVINSTKDIKIENIALLKKNLNTMIWPAGVFAIMLTLLQIGFLFGAYKEAVPPLIYLASILLVIFILFCSKYLKNILKRNLAINSIS